MNASIRTAAIAILGAVVLVACETNAGADAPFDATAQRRLMVADIVAMASDTAPETKRARLSQRVLSAMGRVERHRFVPAPLQGIAYRNEPLPIGDGQTISQPFIVALTTDLVDPQPEHVVLEVGTGSGYQAAVLAELVSRVYSIEIIDALGVQAAAKLTELGYSNVEVRIGDGYAGWPEHALFDSIVVTAAAPFIPEPLLDQLKPGGKMVIPVAASRGGQELLLLEKKPDGTVVRTVVLPVRFVPMTGQGVRGRAK